jgi:hypothetical protein
MEIVIWICELFVQLFVWCVKGVVRLFELIFGSIAAKKEAEEMAKPYVLNTMYTGQGVGAQSTVSAESAMNTESANPVPANTSVATSAQVTDGAMTLNEQIVAMKSIMDDVKPVSRLENLFYQKCLEDYAAAEEETVGWFTFNKKSKQMGYKAMIISLACGFLPIFLIFHLFGNDVVGWAIGVVVAIVVFIVAGNMLMNAENEKMSGYSKCKDELNNIQEQAKAILVSASAKCQVLHPIYCYPQALSTIVQYLERGRASGIKEAINLFENELNGISVQEQNQMLLYFRLREVL